ncbi:Rrf2 family transcriptional regulator [Loigolactobacillus bifermentans]|jgi:DNA-binding IscR family transcriptional regulator|uniref:Transcriptional regulator n=1 Tax=Loigolactobacillus bifermentans DSM 20003 TaxID=1423726 RepID=A0A0R1GHC2_9LACO|nr:Rrf2 family transcriptional regulator [Loigolactobacillus bifermentans]KRK33435.1 transcriptional regulator [Loigolactobacillus bifermentans DSM 20003]QGG61427.1 Rrf2 family transcriptional regulator [Loigolactobacillus bifermentans]
MRLDFSVAVHSLLYLEQKQPRLVASRELATTLTTNPVMIRNILSVLHKAHYIRGVVGKNGGYQLDRLLTDINVGELYDLTIPPTLSYARFITGDLEASGDGSDISRNIQATLTDLFTLADQQYRDFYHQFTLADLKQDLKQHGYFVQLAHEKN